MSKQATVGAGIIPIRMPTWGLSMDEGTIVKWCKAEGDHFKEGEEIAEIETTKINNVFEAPFAGTLRKIVAEEGATIPVGGLLAVAAEPGVEDAAISQFIAEFQATFVKAESDEATPSLEQKLVEVGARRVNVATVGGGASTLVLIHGFSGDLTSWMLNLGELARTHRVIAIDLPGHGASSKDVGNGSVESLARAVVETLDVLKVERADIMGHSLGGAIALSIAKAQPSRVRNLVLIAPAGLPGSTINTDFLDGIVEGQRPRDLKPWLRALFHEPDLASQEMIETMARYKRIDGVEEALSSIRDVLSDDYHSISPGEAIKGSPPALVVLGDDDAIVGSPDLNALPSDWSVVTIVRAGHMPHVERSDEFNSLVSNFLTENS